MNKIFKVIWNHTTQSWVAVSELTSAKGKAKSKTVAKLTALSVAVGSALVGAEALAAVYVNNDQVSTTGATGNYIAITTGQGSNIASAVNSTTTTDFIRIGDANNPFIRPGQIIIGYNIANDSTGEAGDVVIGNRAKIGGGAADSFSTVVGYRAQSAGPSVAMGVGARSDIGSSAGSNSVTAGGVAIGAFAMQGGNVDSGVSIGAVSSSGYSNSVAIGGMSGASNQYLDTYSDVLYNITEGGGGATSVGQASGARGTNSTAIGYRATTAQSGSAGAVAVGYNSHSIGAGSIAMGQGAIAGGFTSAQITALTTQRTNLQTLLASIQTNLTAANTANTTNPTPETKYHVATLLSAQARTQQAIDRITADIARTSANSSQATTTAMALGYEARANNLNTTSIGRGATTNAVSSISLGRGSGVTGVNATRGMALGDGAAVTGDRAAGSTAIGAGANIRQNSTNSIAFGTNASVVGDANGSAGSIAIGNNTAAGNRNANWGANSARELGYLPAQNATAVGSESIAGADNALTLGFRNTVNAPNSTAIGQNNTVGTYNNVAYNNNIATATYVGLNSHVIGANNNVTANNTMVLGNNILVTESNRSGGVVIGDNSSVPTNTTAVNSASVNGITYYGFAGNLGGASEDGTPELASDQGRFVSVGNTTAPRQIKHVAAGEIGANSTDAINGSQLYLLTGAVGNVGTSVANVIGGNTTMYSNGTVANFSQALNTTPATDSSTYTAPTSPAANITQAITNLNDYVNAGWIVGDNTARQVARISPNEQVNFLNGTATEVTVVSNGNGGANISYSTRFDNSTITTNANGQLTANTTGYTLNDNGTINVPAANGAQLMNASTIANAINNASFNVSTATTSGFANQTNSTAKVAAGGNVTYIAGKNIAIEQDGQNFTFSTTQDVTFNSTVVNNTLTIGSGNATNPAINITSAADNGTNQLNMGGAQLNNVTAGTENYTDTVANPTDIAGNVTNARAGLANLSASNQTNVLTVADAAKLGWIVSAADNSYAANVTNANEVRFDGDARLNVTGETDTAGVRHINISINNASLNVTGNNAGDLITTGDNAGSLNVSNIADGVATTKNVAEAINAAYWKVGDNTGTVKHNVSAGHQVNFVNGTATVVNVTDEANGVNNISYSVNYGEGLNVVDGKLVANVTSGVTVDNVTITTNDAGQLTANTTGYTLNDNGTINVPAANGAQLMNATTIANAINNASFNVSTATSTGFATQTNNTAKVSAGGNITYIAGKNIAIEQDGQNFTFSTTQDVTFNSTVVNNTLTIGSGNTTNPAINITSAVNNSTNQLKMGDAQLANVSAGAVTYTTVVDNPSTLANNVTNAKAGLVDFTNSTQNNALTVADAAKMGWIVSANGNDYAANVTNANEVRFNGLNGVNVTGATDTDGVRHINISIAAGTLDTIANGTAANGTTGNFVTDTQVQNAINNSGWLTNVTAADGTVTQTLVKPGTQVNYVNGAGTTANVSADANGTISVSYNVNTTSGTVAADGNGTATVTDGNAFLNASTVANLVNNSSFNATIGTVDAFVTDQDGKDNYKVKAGDTLTFQSGKNLSVNQTNGTFTFSTKENVSFTNANVTNALNIGSGDNITTIASNATGLVLGNATGAPTKIQNVANGDVNADSKDAVNGSQLYNIANSTANIIGGNATFNATTGNIEGFDKTLNTTGANATAADYNPTSPATNITEAINQLNNYTNAGWKIGDTNATVIERIAPNEQVNFVDSSTVKANVVANTQGGANVSFEVNATAIAREAVNQYTFSDQHGTIANMSMFNDTAYVNGDGTTSNVTLTPNGTLQVKYNVNQTTGTVNANGSVSVTDGNAFLNASTVANLVNNSSFNVNSTAVTGTNGQSTYTANDESKVKAGDTVNLNAGQNIKIEGAGKTFNVSTTENVTFTNAQVNSTLSIGAGSATSPTFNITAVNTATTPDVVTNGTAAVNGLDIGGAQLTNVSQGAGVYSNNVDANGRPLTAVTTRDASGAQVTNYYAPDQFNADGSLINGATPSTRVTPNSVANATAGLADLAHANGGNALTVEDARNMGWIVSTSDNDYADSVKNANRVDIKAEANTGVTVKGATNATTGVREIVVGNDYFKANVTSGSAANAAGSNSVAVGPNSVANTAGSVAIGDGATVYANATAGSVAIGQGATAGKANQGDYRIDGSTNGIGGVPTENTRVFSVGNASSPAQIQNVAAGVVAANSTDAVNGSQLHATNVRVNQNAQAINNLNNKVDEVDKRGRKGTAIAGAMGMLPQPHISGKSLVGVATTSYRGEQAVAVGYSRLSDNGKHIIKFSTSTNMSGKKDAMVGAAYGYQW